MLLLVLYLLQFTTASCFPSSNLLVNGSQGGVELQVPSNFKRTRLNAALVGRSAGELQVLLHFKSRLDNSTELADWSAENGHNMCNWTGIACDPLKRHVESMQLFNLGLEGTITPMLGQLHNLQKLDLSYNYLNGSIPASLGNCTRLEELDLSGNDLSGSIPEALGNLGMLRALHLSDNRINGSFPEWIPQLHQLERLDLSRNNFKAGPLISNLPTSIRILRLRRNNLQGIMPSPPFPNCTLLELVDLSDNSLTGSFPKLDSSQAFHELSLTNNSLTGALPALLPKELEELDLSHNSFSGGIPGNWSSTLKKIDLSWNKLSGTIPWTNWSLVRDLDLSHNQLLGPIPFGICAGSLDLSNNQLSGNVPASLGNCSALMTLQLSSNLLSGPVPSSLGNCSALTELDLSNNALEGEIFKDVALAGLEILDVASNRFTGNIVLGSNYSHRLINLGHNNFSGSFPLGLCNVVNHSDSQGLVFLSLASNNLQGSIPSCITNLTDMQVLDLSSNHLTGPIPHNLQRLVGLKNGWIGNRSISNHGFDMIKDGHWVRYEELLEGITVFDLSNNNLEGEIPVTIGQLDGIRFLNLSHNNLSSTIPWELGNISKLQSLDLSYNHLQGPIPSSIASIDLTSFSVANNNLSGPIPTADDFNTRFDTSSFEGNAGLHGCPLQPCAWGRRPNPPIQQQHTDEDSSAWSCFGAALIAFCVTLVTTYTLF